ncbi:MULTISPECIES: ABC transporter ATP-binding protein [Flavobacterium]|uniref:ABC transporter ATP-binding protein n=1 Tax=Flavobacterium jumunjinense TaxID=998845 RepID=A0ABV5GIV8_9FLAO|nr:MULTISPECIES: ABC transporter ATP-binding protein [Flavobacterium]
MLTVSNSNFSYKDKSTLKDINFKLEKGTNLALIGESGCGKSTLLKIIYGLYDLDEGEIFWNDQQVLGPKHHLVPGMPFMKYLAQDFDLMPFITVAENVGKYLSNFYPEEKQERIIELLEVVEMTDFANEKVKYLSGGQMQRVALAKVLALEPELLLLDEPFSHIDNFLKNSLRRKIFKYLKEKEITCIVATHDANDILSFSDEVLVLRNGTIIDVGETREIYSYPGSFYVASLFGEVNEIKWEDNVLYVYPHQLEVSENSTFEVVVKETYFRGNNYLVEAIFNNQIVFFESRYDIPVQRIVGLQIKIDL